MAHRNLVWFGPVGIARSECLNGRCRHSIGISKSFDEAEDSQRTWPAGGNRSMRRQVRSCSGVDRSVGKRRAGICRSFTCQGHHRSIVPLSRHWSRGAALAPHRISVVTPGGAADPPESVDA